MAILTPIEKRFLDHDATGEICERCGKKIQSGIWLHYHIHGGYRLVAPKKDNDQGMSPLHRICAERVLKRGQHGRR